MKPLYLIALLFFFIPLLFCHSGRADDLILDYTVAAIAQNGKNGSIFPLRDNTTLQSGDLIKFYIELAVDGHVYCYHEDDKGHITLLYPTKFQSSNLRKETSIFIPDLQAWLQLDSHPGKEKFHIILSPNGIAKLDALNNDYWNDQKDSRAFLSEIAKLSHTLYTKADKPIQIAGRVKGISYLNQFMSSAKRVSTKGPSVESFLILHE